MTLTVDGYARRPCGGGDRVEDHAADAIHTGRRGAPGLGVGIVGVGGARDGDPVGGAGDRADDGTKSRVSARHAERHGRRIH